MSRILRPIDHDDLTPGVSLSDEVYARVGAAILDGTLAAGQRLRDVDIAAQLGISRTPVREALQRLARFGLVEIAVGRYTRVSIPDERLRRETAVFTAYMMGSAMRLALIAASDDELAGIVAHADGVLAGVRAGDLELVFTRCAEMFEAITRATHNSVFTGVVRESALVIERNLRGWDPFLEGAVPRVDLYERLRAQLRDRDGSGAESTLRELHDVA